MLDELFRQACKLVSSKEYPFLLSQLVKVSDLGSKHDMPFKVETHNLPLLSATILLIALLGRPFSSLYIVKLSLILLYNPMPPP